MVFGAEIFVFFGHVYELGDLGEVGGDHFGGDAVLEVEHLVDLDDQHREFSQPREVLVLEQDVEELAGSLRAVDVLVTAAFEIDKVFMQPEQDIPGIFELFGVVHS